VILSVIGIVVQVVLRLLFPTIAPGVHHLIIIMLFMGGIQLLCLSIIGSYIAHIYDEVKRASLFGGEYFERPARHRERANTAWRLNCFLPAPSAA